MTEQTTETEPVDEQVEETTELGTEETSEQEVEPETFPRAYVEELRQEAADARVKAKRADDLAARLHVALTAATGRLADPSDLPFEDAHLDDPQALTTALDQLLVRKPHLANRKPRGDVGQGATSTNSSAVDLGSLLRQRA